jgi:hypothetical protein
MLRSVQTMASAAADEAVRVYSCERFFWTAMKQPGHSKKRGARAILLANEISRFKDNYSRA